MQKHTSRMPAFIRLLRPKHWIKNLLVFIPAFFGGRLLLPGGMLAFVTMSLAASGVYAINDCHDAPQDRLHPDKCRRPVASGAVSQPMALTIAALCFIAAFALPPLLGMPLAASAVLALYVAMNLSYSVLGFKNIPIIDVTIVAMGFVLRILYGAMMTDIAVSNWLLLTVLMGSYYMALGKRRNELRDVKADTRAVLKAYTYAFLNQHMYLFLTLTIAFYSLWSVDATTVQNAVLSIPLVVVLAMRYNLDVEGNHSGDPIEVISRDRVFIALLALYGALMFALLYLQGGGAA